LADLSRVFGTGLYWYSGQVQSGGGVLLLLKIGASMGETTPPTNDGGDIPQVLGRHTGAAAEHPPIKRGLIYFLSKTGGS
jgi:hypothetical protein